MSEYSSKKSRRAAEYKQCVYNQGLCVRCRQPRDDERRLCASCRGKRSKEYKQRCEQRLRKGLCKACGKPQAENSNLYCLEHWFKKLSVDATGTTNHWQAIQELLIEQDYRCPYTGTKLVLGKNAQLDHKVPLDLGGSNEPNNLHWVDAEINRMKGKRTHLEFISICKTIASRF